MLSLDLSVSSSSWGLGRAAVCDCGTPWTFLLPFFFYSLLLVIYSASRFGLSLALCYYIFVFFSPLNIAIISLGEERGNLYAFRTFVRFALVWFCLFPHPLGVLEWLWLVIVALPGLFSLPFWYFSKMCVCVCVCVCVK